MIKIFLIEYKFILTEENLFLYHEKGDIMKIYFIKHKVILIE